MSEFGHEGISGPGLFLDSWGAGPYIIRTAGKMFRFEDSDRWGPIPVGLNGDPTAKGFFHEGSKFWPAWKRWKDEGRQVDAVVKRGRNGIEWHYCKFTDLRRKLPT